MASSLHLLAVLAIWLSVASGGSASGEVGSDSGAPSPRVLAPGGSNLGRSEFGGSSFGGSDSGELDFARNQDEQIRQPFFNSLGQLARPPMGWNSYNHFGCNITEELIRETADALVSTGLADLGYKFVNIDDCWSAVKRDDLGRLQSDPVTFPSGIKALADYVHDKGLKLGIYADAGYATCLFRAGSLGFESVDAQTFADWEVDYLKYDNCDPGTVNSLPFARYRAMGLALKAVDRRIIFSMCEWGLMGPALWAKQTAHADLWRTTPDIINSWDSVMAIAGNNNRWAAYAGPGGWNDPDMLQVGNGALTPGEERVHFSLWAMMKAPLILGCDIRNVPKSAMETITNKYVISINQDALGVQATRVLSQGDTEVWAGPLTRHRTVVALVNRGHQAANISVNVAQSLGVPWPEEGQLKVKDVWEVSGVFEVVLQGRRSASGAQELHPIEELVTLPFRSLGLP